MEPNLRLVSLSDIQLQEEADQKRLKRLIAGMRTSKVVRDPPIVATGIHDDLIQLDGTTRLSALRRMNCSHAVVQYVDYNDSSQVTIKSWVHVSKVNRDTFLQRIRAIGGIKTEPFQLGLGLTLTGHPLAAVTIIFRDGKGLSVINNTGLVEKVLLMKRVVKLYEELIERNREVSIEGMTQLREFFRKHSDKNVALFFPTFAAHEVYALMQRSVTLPQGITRHVVNGRVLGINYPVTMLEKGTPLKEKEAYFAHFLKTTHLRFYEESTFMVE